MIAEFESKSWRDFSQRYRGTYGWFHAKEKGKVLVKVIEVGEDSVSFEDSDGLRYQGIADRGNVFEFLPIERAVYNTHNDVIFAERTAARQWRRGLCRENTSFVSLTGNNRADVSFKLISEIFSGDTYDHYVAQFKSGYRPYVALDVHFSILNTTLYAYDRKIGTYNPKEKLIVMNSPMYTQEINDIVRHHQLAITVMEK